MYEVRVYGKLVDISKNKIDSLEKKGYSIYANDKLTTTNAVEEYVYSIAEPVGKFVENLYSDEKAIVYYNGREFVFETLSEALMFIEEEDI